MKRGILLIILLALATLLLAENEDWLWVTSVKGYSFIYGCDITVDNKDNIWITGETINETISINNLTIDGSGAFFAKGNPDNHWLWGGALGAYYNNSGYDRISGTPHLIRTDEEGNVYMAGDCDNVLFGDPVSKPDNCISLLFIAKTDNEGNILWVNYACGHWFRLLDMVIDSSGNTYFIGSSGWDTVKFGDTTLENPRSLGMDFFFIVKIDPNGNWLWVKSLEASSSYSLALDSKDNLIVTGWYDEPMNDDWEKFKEPRPLLAKMDPEGKWLWTKSSDVYYGDYKVFDVKVDSSDNIIMVGYFTGMIDFGEVSLISGYSSNCVFIAKADSDGNWLWAQKTKAFGEGGFGTKLVVDASNNSYVLGSTNGTTYFGDDIVTNSGEDDLFIAKVDADGNWCWVKYAEGALKEIYVFDISPQMDIDSSGNIYIIGTYIDTVKFGNIILEPEGESSLYIAKLDTKDPVSVEDKLLTPLTTDLLCNYPNPFNPETQLQFSLAEPGLVKIEVYNLKGQKVKTLTDNYYAQGHHTLVWNGSDDSDKQVSSGIYFYRMETDNFIKTRRMSLIK
ncbi:MAG: T9SS type A sorting domain-containing protein [Candidatus Cloacimonadia bacterium]|jgi:hypothetical protein